ncbi:transporter substrate-binding domain-containing protein [Brucella intermedia]|uniref:transporter substrate-binding domain-containing protein n=1 Tax=Brucella intermedia TaxID=94625 RepID=UPI00224B422A|nr:transporter substrate-binding domain-containing protein [Brucella intermedia]
MGKLTCKIGVLISTTGAYGAVGRAILNGTLLACAQVNSDPSLNVRLEPIHFNPDGDLVQYAAATKRMFDDGIRHVVGCYTSSSRKEVIPLFEKFDGLLWYPTHYEGFESSLSVVYTGTSPNHHMSPLMDFLMLSYGRKAFCVGSNYIWGWESIRILREYFNVRKGQVLAERYLAVGETDVSQIIENIFEEMPDFIFNALIGSSAYAFFEQFRRACSVRGIDQAQRFPIASCNLSEPDLTEIAEDCRDGHISSSVYFSVLDNPVNQQFVSQYNAAFPAGPPAAAEGEAAYIATKFLGMAISAANSADPTTVRAAVAGMKLEAPQGIVTMDPDTHHASLTPRIGRSRRNCEFDILMESPEPVRPDPYLVSADSLAITPITQTRLRVVS